MIPNLKQLKKTKFRQIPFFVLGLKLWIEGPLESLNNHLDLYRDWPPLSNAKNRIQLRPSCKGLYNLEDKVLVSVIMKNRFSRFFVSLTNMKSSSLGSNHLSCYTSNESGEKKEEILLGGNGGNERRKGGK